MLRQMSSNKLAIVLSAMSKNQEEVQDDLIVEDVSAEGEASVSTKHEGTQKVKEALQIAASSLQKKAKTPKGVGPHLLQQSFKTSTTKDIKLASTKPA